MKVGDHILSIGEVSLRGMTSEQVAQVLRSQGSAVRLLLARPYDPQIAAIVPPVINALSHTAIMPTRLLTDLEEVHRHLAAAESVPEVSFSLMNRDMCDQMCMLDFSSGILSFPVIFIVEL